jgi:methyltransferase (TIGR00027 family)
LIAPARPSRSALRVALRRAAHQIYDAHPLVFEDPLAVSILGVHAQELDRTPGRSAAFKPRPSSASLRAFVVARSRYAEDLLAEAVARGVTQYVLLGAGLDTFAHRNPHAGLRVFEVDERSTQQWKRDLLRTASLPIPQGLTYVPVDLAQQSLAIELQAAGFDPSARTFFAWLGVVPYLGRNAFRNVIRYIADQPRGSGLVFDYRQPRSALDPVEQREHDSLASRVKLAGESFQTHFTPAEIAAEMAGFRDRRDLGSAEINTLYFANRVDALRLLGNAARIASGWI